MKLWTRFLAFSVILLATACGSGLAKDGASSGPLKLAGPDAPVTAPYRGLLYSPDDIKAIRQILQSKKTNRKPLARRYVKEAQWWLDRGRKGVDELLPPDGSVYAYGVAGDPKSGKSWPRFGRSHDVCSLERPGQVKSPYTGEVYGIQKPGEKYHDPGDGWVDPETDTRYYFKGIWNGYAIYKMHEAVDALAIAYMLTGDERCAELGLYILDQFAGLRHRNPKNNGLIDYPHRVAPGYGFFGFMGNIANTRMTLSALSFDLLAGSKYARQPSAVTKGLTVAQNIQQNYFEVFEPWKLTKLNSFQNHAIAAFGSMLSQALLFGDAERTRLGIDLAYAFFDCSINRDGDYYEMSGDYGGLGRGYGGPILYLLSSYRPERYDPSAKMPDPKDYPYALQFGDNPLWYKTAIEMLYRHSVLGRGLQYGDAHPDREILPGTISRYLARDRATFLCLLYQQTTRPDWRQELARRYWELPNLDGIAINRDDLICFGPAIWLEPEKPSTHASSTTEEELGSDIMPAKRLAIFRSGEGKKKRAFYILGGASNSHAHDDKMALIPYGEGMSLTGEYGYYYYGTPDFCGWGTHGIAHNMVVVNEDLPQPPFLHIAPWKRVPPADITASVKQKPAQLVEMRNPVMWHGVAEDMQDYRRTAWLVDLPDNAYYFVDVFQVLGGKTHDYAWHSPYLDPQQKDDGFRVNGVKLEPKKDTWVLAALNNEELRDATYNKPGQAWGERLLGKSGLIKDLKIPGEKLASWQWSPPPGNGYGFIYDIRSAPTTNDWTAQWLLHDNKHTQRLHVLNYDGMTAIRGKEPTLQPGYRQTVAIARRTQSAKDTGPLHSRFVTVDEVGQSDQFPLKQVQRVKTTGSTPEQDRVALAVEAQDGTRDTILVNRSGGRSTTEDHVTLDGHRAFVRRDSSGAVNDLLLQEGTSLEADGIALKTDSPAWEAKVIGVDLKDEGFSIEVSGSLPEGDRLRGSMILFSCPTDTTLPYSHTSYYEVEQVKKEGDHSRLIFTEQKPAMAYLQIESVDSAKNILTTRFPCEFVSLPEMDYFKGRRAIVVSGKKDPANSRIIAFKDKKTVQLEDVSGFKPGDRVAILTVQKGDLLRIPSQVSLNRTAPGQYQLHSTHDVTITLPGKEPVRVKVKTGPTILQ